MIETRYNTCTLANGLRIIHLPQASPVVYCGYGVCAGTKDEAEGDEGLAHFCEHVTFKGTAKRSSMQVLNCLEGVGGELNAFTNKEDTVFYAAVLKEQIGRAVDLLTDIVMHSTYPQAEIDKEVEVICDEIESYNDSPAELIYDEFENAIFAHHPLGHNILGSAERLRQYTTADALRFTSRFYRPENAVFFASGDISFTRLVKLLERATSDFSAHEPLRSATAEAAFEPLKEQMITVSKGTHQAHVMMGSRTFGVNGELRMPLYLLNNIIGGPGMNAKLNVALREKKGLVYTVESSMVCYSDTGMWCVYFGCDPSDVPTCRRLVHRELERMSQSPMTEARLKAAKRQIKGQIAVACDNRENFALDFCKSYLHYGRKRDINRLMQKIDAITADDMLRTAQEVFSKDKMLCLQFV